MSGGSSGTLGTSAKGTRPPLVPSTKSKSQDSSFNSSKGTSVTRKRKFGSLFTVSGDLIERKLDPAANKKISHSTDYFLYISECVSMDMVDEVDKLDINEHYSQALKACYNLSGSLSSASCLSIFFYIIFFPLQAAFYLGHSLRDFSDTSATQAKVKKLREELKLSQSQKEKLAEEVRALKGRLDDLSRENIRISKDFEEAEARHDELLSRKKDMLTKLLLIL